MNAFLLVLALAASAFTACSSSDEQACTPGASVACIGPNQCQGFQVCEADGAGFGACDCGAGATSSSTSDSSTTGATSGGATSGAGGAGSTSSGATTTSGTGGSGGSGGDWSPSNLAGLSLWLHSGAGLVYDPQHPGIILKWNDQSPNAHQAVLGGNQPGEGATIDPQALNGLDGVKCPGYGMELRITDHPSLQFGTGGHMIAAVVRTSPQSFPSNYYIKDGVGTGIALHQPNQSTLSYTHGLENLSVNITTAAPAWYLATLRGPAMELEVGMGKSSGPVSTANVDNPGGWALVCDANSSANEIAELIVVKGDVSDTDYDKTRQYLKEKYGL